MTTTADTHTNSVIDHQADVCTKVPTFLAMLLLIVGAVATNIGHLRFGDKGTDWVGFSLVFGLAAVVFTIGTCAAAICRQLAYVNNR